MGVADDGDEIRGESLTTPLLVRSVVACVVSACDVPRYVHVYVLIMLCHNYVYRSGERMDVNANLGL